MREMGTAEVDNCCNLENQCSLIVLTSTFLGCMLWRLGPVTSMSPLSPYAVKYSSSEGTTTPRERSGRVIPASWQRALLRGRPTISIRVLRNLNTIMCDHLVVIKLPMPLTVLPALSHDFACSFIDHHQAEGISCGYWCFVVFGSTGICCETNPVNQ